MVTRNYEVRGGGAAGDAESPGPATPAATVATVGTGRRGALGARPLVRPPPAPPLCAEPLPPDASPRAAAARIAEELVRHGRFQYLGDRPLEVTDSLKGYRRSAHLGSSRGSSTDAIYRAEPGRGRGGGAGGAGAGGGGGEWWRERPRAWRLLRWAAPVAALLLALALVLYFVLADMQGPSQAPVLAGHPWGQESDGAGNAADDVVSLDGDVILDLGDVTYHEGQFHVARGGAGAAAGGGGEADPAGATSPASPAAAVAGGGGGAGDEGGAGGGSAGGAGGAGGASNESRPDFIEIVPAPDLGTSAAAGAPTEPFAPPTEPPATERDAADDFLYATSQLLAKLKATAHLDHALLTAKAKTASQEAPALTALTSRLPVAPTVPPPPPPPAALPRPDATAPSLPPPAPTPNDTDSALCFSPRLPLCRGVLPYDLTTLPLVPGVRRLRDLDAALPYFDMVVESGCSARARQFVCSLLEPACQPAGAGPLLPCRKACKAVAEDCSDFILATLDLSRVFQCERYPDLEDATQCVNFARGDSCLRGEFWCPDGTCVPGRWRCDGVRDCAGGADERNCASCNPDEFRCEADRKCVPARWRCDGQRDCPDASDEFGCPARQGCAPGHFQCSDQSACVPERWLCDGLTHCPDASDERNCTGLHCHAGDFQCRKTGQCIPAQWRCNGVNDCADNSDEDHCTVIHTAPRLTAMPHTSPCPAGELRCLDGRCITLQQLCDRRQDCSDGADEANCGGGGE